MDRQTACGADLALHRACCDTARPSEIAAVTTRVCGHFGEWVQGRLGPDGPIALVTVSCPPLSVVVDFRAGPTRMLRQAPTLLDAQHGAAFLEHIGAAAGTYSLTGNMLPGGGAGASTAALIALGRSTGASETDILNACLAVEGASDPLMLDRPDGVLWASRHGRSLATLPPLPRAEIVGGFWGAPQRTDPQDGLFPDIADLADALQAPMDLEALADLATTSARRCSQLRGPQGDPTPDLAVELHALGYLRAHTGSARGLIFPPGHVPAEAQEALRDVGFTRVVQFQTGCVA